MRKLSLFAATLVLMLFTVLPAGAASAAPLHHDDDSATSFFFGDEDGNGSSTGDETIDELLEQLFGTLADNPPLMPGTGNGSTDCNPLSPTCLYDPIYGSCEWDAWRGVYVCDSYQYMPGYDCAYDWWYEQYVCRENGGYGGYGGWGSTWGW